MRIPVLTYHALHAPGWEYHSNDHIALERDLAVIRESGRRVVPLSRLVSHLFEQPDPDLNDRALVALSFDDGSDHDYRDYSHPDWGHLKSFRTLLTAAGDLGWDGGIPQGTSFVIVSPDARRQLDERLIAGRGQWQEDWWLPAAREGVLEIGNHSWDHAHPALDQVAHSDQTRRSSMAGSFMAIDDQTAADTQVLQAEQYLENTLGHHRTGLFAYPFGEASDYLAGTWFPAHADRFQAAFVTGGDYVTARSDRWRLPRFVCGEHWRTPQELAAILHAAG